MVEQSKVLGTRLWRISGVAARYEYLEGATTTYGFWNGPMSQVLDSLLSNLTSMNETSHLSFQSISSKPIARDEFILLLALSCFMPFFHSIDMPLE
jgi:hypothetical protein